MISRNLIRNCTNSIIQTGTSVPVFSWASSWFVASCTRVLVGKHVNEKLRHLLKSHTKIVPIQLQAIQAVSPLAQTVSRANPAMLTGLVFHNAKHRKFTIAISEIAVTIANPSEKPTASPSMPACNAPQQEPPAVTLSSRYNPVGSSVPRREMAVMLLSDK